MFFPNSPRLSGSVVNPVINKLVLCLKPGPGIEISDWRIACYCWMLVLMRVQLDQKKTIWFFGDNVGWIVMMNGIFVFLGFNDAEEMIWVIVIKSPLTAGDPCGWNGFQRTWVWSRSSLTRPSKLISNCVTARFSKSQVGIQRPWNLRWSGPRAKI